MNNALAERLNTVRQVFWRIHYVAIATTGTNGEPHNTPVFAVFDDKLRMFWASSPGATHSRNIARSGQVYIVVFDSSTGKGGGVFIEAQARELTADSDIVQALQVTEKITQTPRYASEFQGESPQRMYCAEPLQLWVNMSQKDANGHIRLDQRYTIKRSELVGE